MTAHPPPKGCGPTTGTCAAAAAFAAAEVWRGEAPPERVAVALPEGGILDVGIASAARRADGAEAVVVKPDNDDDDATRGLAIRVRIARRAEPGLAFAAGEGVGTITRPGLSLPPGEPAINPTPRAMIAEALSGLGGGWLVEVSVPGGSAAAEKTYNPRLGVEGGISIIGTSGLVRPYCGAARRAAFLCSFRVARESGRGAIVMTPGHIGRRAVEAKFRFAPDQLLEVGNAWDDAFELARPFRFDAVLAAGHPGKLAKLADGPLDTHSARSRSATEILNPLLAGIDAPPAAADSTAEAIFAALPPDLSRKLAEAAAERVRRALHAAGAAANVAVWLCDLKGNELGCAGDLTPWL